MTSIKKHSKYKNTGILFELLVRQVTSDMITDRDSKAVKIIKKYFTNTEIAREYNLYNAILKSPKLSENKAESFINTVIEESRKLDRDVLDKEKYGLIREIKKYYDVEEFFKAKINNYKTSAAIYTLFENAKSKSTSNLEYIVVNKSTLIEHICQDINSTDKVKVVEDFLKEDKDIRILAYKLIVEKYNEAYSELSKDQKDILKEYINNISDTKQLREYLNGKLQEVKTALAELVSQIDDKVVAIKLKEVINLASPINQRHTIKDEHLVALMQYYELLKELKSTSL